MHVYLNQIIQSLHRPHPLQPYWQNLLAQVQTEALKFALEKQLFLYLSVPQHSQAIAEKLALHQKNTEYFLQLLASMQILELRSDSENHCIHYCNTELTQRYFYPESPEYCGDAFLFRHQVISSVVTQFPEYLAENFTPTKKSAQINGQAWANAALSQIAQEQNAVTIAIADTLSELIIEFHTAQQLLDVGAGSGLISMHFAEKFPQLECTVLELPEVIAAIESNLKQHPAQHRLHCCTDDLHHLQANTTYDIIWCSSVLHFVEDYQNILKQFHKALKPNGILICAHSEIDLNHLDPLIHSYYFNMRLQGNFVPTKDEIANTLMQLGYQNIHTIENVKFPVAPLHVIIARK